MKTGLYSFFKQLQDFLFPEEPQTVLKQRMATLSVLKARSPKLRCASENSS